MKTLLILPKWNVQKRSGDSHLEEAYYSVVTKRKQVRSLLKWGYLYRIHIQGGEVKPVPSVKKTALLGTCPQSAASPPTVLPPDLALYHGCLTWKSLWLFVRALQRFVRMSCVPVAELEVVRLPCFRQHSEVHLVVWKKHLKQYWLVPSAFSHQTQHKLPPKTCKLYSLYFFLFSFFLMLGTVLVVTRRGDKNTVCVYI